ncbi:MAG: aminotransferase class IV [Legionella sp.]|nr:aminotransferase class IV [Legionella sp.]
MPLAVVLKKDEIAQVFASDDRIFLGEGLVETLRVEEGTPHYADLHWQRLQQSTSALGIAFDLSFDDWCANLAKCIASAQLINGGVKALLSAGRAPRGLAEKGTNPCLFLEAFSYKKNSSAIKLVSAPWLRDGRNPVYQLKSVNYLEAILAARHAQTRGADDALFFNIGECATETTIANLFLIKEGKLFTPSAECGILTGITRGRILLYCRERNIPCYETTINKHMLREADVLFTSNALQGIRAVSAFDALSFDTNHPLLTQLTAFIN